MINIAQHESGLEAVFNLSPRLVNSLYRLGITTSDDLKKIPNEEYLLKIRGIGQRGLSDIKMEYQRIFGERLFIQNSQQRKLFEFSNNTQSKLVEYGERIDNALKSIEMSSYRILNRMQAKKTLEIKELYDQLGTLELVSKKLSITRERVRQLLERGNKLGLFKYEITRTVRFNQLVKKITRMQIIEEMKKGKKVSDICSILQLDFSQYFNLVKFYNIDREGYRIDAKKKKYLIQYMNLVEKLGYHPTTTEMSKNTV